MGTGSYIGHQVAQIFHSGIRAGGGMKDDAYRKGDRSGGWIYGIVTFLFVAISRATLAVLLIPLHAIAALLQPDQTKAAIVTQVVTLAVMFTVSGIAVYRVRNASRPQVVNINTSPGTSLSAVRPSFDCAKAQTPVELLICRDSQLAGLESVMASSCRQALNRLPRDRQLALRREHVAWFKNYNHTCEQSANDAARATCIADFLSTRTVQLSD